MPSSLSKQEQKILEKLRKVPPENLHEIETFIDFLSLRYQDRQLVDISKRLSNPVFQKVWDNDEDASYDEL
ncbi:toxin-antitoxin system, antitoxin component, Xre family protein [Phormidium willei BDU 130791]|nr:toxin-antitoxin system, antitoxin component, Xre family protein [Phormidium willei BDU 130791]